jgi:site-specific recombinase XerD
MPQIQHSNGNKRVVVVGISRTTIPKLFVDAGDEACRRYIEFFTATIRNKNTRAAYLRATRRFVDWCESSHLALGQISPPIVAAYVEQMGKSHSVPSVKQHLAAIRNLMDYLTTGNVTFSNPATSVRGPKHVVRRGKTPVLSTEQARTLLDAIDTSTITGLRDRALVGVMVYSFARVSAVIGMNGGDYFSDGNRFWFRLKEKGGRHHEVPAHHRAQQYVDEYLRGAGIMFLGSSPLFRTIDRHRRLTDRRLNRREVLAMIKKYAKKAGLPSSICCHTFRATGITSYLIGGGTLERAQQIAAHADASTTKLYDRRDDAITSEEIERIVI